MLKKKKDKRSLFLYLHNQPE